MFIEQYLDRPLQRVNTGFADEKEFLGACAYTGFGMKRGSNAIFPVRSAKSGQFLLNSREQHTLIAGCTGSGKTRRVLIPAIMNAMKVSGEQDRPSMFIWDVKGEISRYTAGLAQRQGYSVVTIDMIHPENSDGYSIVELARERWMNGDCAGAENALADLATAICPPPKNSSLDTFWSKTGQAGIIGTSLYLLETSPNTFSFVSVTEKIMEVFGDENTARRFLASAARHCGQSSSAYRFLKTALSGSDKTLQNVCSSLMADVSEFLKTHSVVEIQAKPIHEALKRMGAQPTVVYFKTSEAQPTLYSFGKLIFSQLYQRLLEEAGVGALKRPFEFFMDEICNGQPIEGLDRMLAMARSKNIRIHLVVQSLNQIRVCYGESSETIRSSCGVMIVLRTTDPGTWDLVSALCGSDIRGYSLLTRSDLAHLELGRAVILTPGHLPFVGELCDFTDLEKIPA